MWVTKTDEYIDWLKGIPTRKFAQNSKRKYHIDNFFDTISGYWLVYQPNSDDFMLVTEADCLRARHTNTAITTVD